eukprot:1744670-Amphidinium_carterae.1
MALFRYKHRREKAMVVPGKLDGVFKPTFVEQRLNFVLRLVHLALFDVGTLMTSMQKRPRRYAMIESLQRVFCQIFAVLPYSAAKMHQRATEKDTADQWPLKIFFTPGRLDVSIVHTVRISLLVTDFV